MHYKYEKNKKKKYIYIYIYIQNIVKQSTVLCMQIIQFLLQHNSSNTEHRMED
jgi:hypothetical protein